MLKVQRAIFVVSMDTARKGQDTSTRIAQIARTSNLDLDLDLDLDLERNVVCMERLDTLMLTVGKSSLTRHPNGIRT